MISIIQILSVIFGLFMLYTMRVHTQKKYYSKSEAYFWTALWICFIYIALFPQTFSGVIQRLQIARVFDLLVIIAFMIVTFLAFQNRVEVRDLSGKLEKVVREKALNEKTKKATKN